MKKLLCHTELIMSYGVALSEGKIYGVYEENSESFFITDENGEEHEFTKQPDNRGLSYKTWFEIISE